MEQSLVSVVLCTYNGEKYLTQQLDSILKQSYQPLELIISDDASTDATPLILEKYSDHPGVRIFIQKDNIGLAENFAFAASQANAALIAFCDQDDIWLEDKIEKLVAAIGDSPLVYSDSLLIDADGQSLDKKLSDLRNMYSGHDSRCFVLYTCVSGHTMLVTKALLDKALPIPAGIQHDDWLAVMAAIYGGIKYHDEVLTHYRRHDDTVSKSLPEKQGARTVSRRYRDYEKLMYWIGIIRTNERAAQQPFYDTLYKLYQLKASGKYVWPLFFFLLKNRKDLFRLSKKNILSQLVEIGKQARGERNTA